MPALEPLPRYSRLVVFGDMLSPIGDIEPAIRGFAAMGVDGHIIQVNDVVEETLPFRGRIRFDGLEGEGSALIGRVEMVRDDYVELMASHRKGLADIARSVGWTFAVHIPTARRRHRCWRSTARCPNGGCEEAEAMLTPLC